MFRNFGACATLAQLVNQPNPTVDQVLSKVDLKEIIQETSEKDPLMHSFIEFTQRNLAKLLSVALREISPDAAEKNMALATVYPANATALLCNFVQNAVEEHGSIHSVIPVVFGTLSRKATLHAVIAQNMNNIVLSAFTEDPLQTMHSIQVALNSEVLHGTIRHLCKSSVVEEMLIGILGVALNADSCRLFPSGLCSEPWNQLQFAEQLAAYAKIAMAGDDNGTYFDFVSELLSKGLHQQCGPLVDEFLSETSVTLFVEAVLEASEEELQMSVKMNNEEEEEPIQMYPLVAEGWRVVLGMLKLIALTQPKPSFLGANGGASLCYHSSLQNLPARKVLKELPRLVKLMEVPSAAQGDATRSRSGKKLPPLGMVRICLAELFATLFSYENETIDEALINCQVLETLLQLHSLYPSHDLLLGITDKIFQSFAPHYISSAHQVQLSGAVPNVGGSPQARSPKPSENASFASSGSSAAGSANISFYRCHIQDFWYTSRGHAILQSIISWGDVGSYCSQGQPQHTSIRAHAIFWADVVSHTLTIPHNKGSPECGQQGSLLPNWSSFVETLYYDIDTNKEKLTGKDFQVENSGCSVPVTHRPVCNPRESSLSPSTSPRSPNFEINEVLPSALQSAHLSNSPKTSEELLAQYRQGGTKSNGGCLPENSLLQQKLKKYGDGDGNEDEVVTHAMGLAQGGSDAMFDCSSSFQSSQEGKGTPNSTSSNGGVQEENVVVLQTSKPPSMLGEDEDEGDWNEVELQHDGGQMTTTAPPQQHITAEEDVVNVFTPPATPPTGAVRTDPPPVTASVTSRYMPDDDED